MAVTLTGNLKINESIVYGSFMDRTKYLIDTANANLNGAIIVGSSLISEGFHEETSFVKGLVSSINRRDVTADEAATDLALSEDTTTRTRLSRRFGPVAWSEGAYRIKNLNPDIVSDQLGRDLANYSYEEMLKTSVDSLVSAIGKVGTEANYVGPDDDDINTVKLVNVLEKRGPKLSGGQLWVFDAITYYKLFKDQVNATATGFGSSELANAILVTPNPQLYGIPALVVDTDTLHVEAAGSRTKDIVLLLNQGSCRINQGEVRALGRRVDGRTNILRRWQAEYDYDLSIKGMNFSTATNNPTSVQLTTAANWTFKYTNRQDGPGYKGNYDIS